MRKMFFAAFAVFSLVSCTFVRFDTKAFKSLLESEGVDFGTEKASVVVPKGEIKTEIRNVSDFTGIESALPIDIEISDGEQFLQLSAPANVLPVINTEVKDGILKLSFDGARVRNASNIKAVIRLSKLSYLKIKGAGDVNLEGHIETDVLDIELNGAGDIEIDDLVASRLDIELNGAGDIEVEKMNCESFDAHINGAGGLEAENINVRDLRMSVSGAADCVLAGYAAKGDFSINGTGVIDIRKLRIDSYDQHVSGFAKIKKN